VAIHGKAHQTPPGLFDPVAPGRRRKALLGTQTQTLFLALPSPNIHPMEVPVKTGWRCLEVLGDGQSRTGVLKFSAAHVYMRIS